MNKAKIAAFGLSGLLVVLMLVFTLGIDVRPALGPIVRQIETTTGYRLQIDGAAKIALRPFLVVVADNVRLANADAVAGQELLAAERVQIALSVRRLITGDVSITDLTLRRPVWHVGAGRQVSGQTQAQSSGSAAQHLRIERINIEDGTLILHTPQGIVETLLDRIQLKASLPAGRGVDINAEARSGGQRLRMSAATDRPLELSSERPVGLTAMVSSVDAPQRAISMTGKLSLNGQILQLDDLKGAVDQDPFGGSAAVDLSRSRPHARAEVNFTRVRVGRAPPASVVNGDQRAVVSQAPADKPWSNAPIDLLPLNLFDADVKLSADELLLGKVRLAPAAVNMKLVSGVAVIALSRTQLYGGEARGTLVFDASGPHPRCISQITLSAVNALALLEDATDFDRLDGHIDAKLDLSASGESVRALLSSLGGTADIEFADATIRGVNLPRMVELLTKKSLQGWRDDGSTRLESLGATFRVKDGVATTDDLRAIGPLVSVTGRGAVDLVGRTLEFVTDPKLVLALKGEGRAADAVGLGVPVIVRGPWSSPQIYPDVANVLENPDNAYAKLAELGAGLFGLAKKRPGFSLESIVDEVASIVADPERQPSAPKRQELVGQDPAKPAAVEPPSAEIAGHLQVAEATSKLRVALVIGNASYPDNGEPLAEPIKDARAMAEALRKSGFEVIVGENLAKQATRAAIANFKAKVKPGSAALIFFSGFGIQSQRQSYVIPVDAQIWTEADVSRDGVSLEQVLTDLDSLGARIKIAIIDASRKNPFERRFRRYSAGLASIEAPTGTLVLSAAAPGRVGIEDRTGGSVFITQLLKEMRSPGVPAEEVFNRTRVGVSRASNNAQVPWMSSSLSEVFYFDATTSIPASSVVVEPARPASATKSERPKAEKSPVEPQKLESAKAETAPPSKPQDSPGTTTGRLPNGANQTLKTLGDAIRLHPDDANAFYRRGLVYAENEDYEHAAADFSEAIRLNPSDAEALNNRCWTRAILGQLQAALDDCNEALRLRPTLTDAFDSRGLTQLKLGHYRQAIADFDMALQSNPKQVSSLYGRGKAKLKSGDSTGGDADIKSAKTMDPNIVDEFAKYGAQ